MLTASTQRSPALVAGKGGKPVTCLASVTLAFAPMPLSPEVTEKYQLQSPRKAFVTGVNGTPDILEGDILTVSGVAYHIRAVGKWTAPVAYTKLILEQVTS